MSNVLSKKITASVVLVTLLTMISSPAYAASSNTSGTSVSYRNLVGSTAGKSDLIKNEVKNFQVLIDSGAMQPRAAVDTFSKNLMDQGVTFSDLDAYVKERSTRDEYKKFQTNFESSMTGIDAQNITATEMSQVSAQLLSAQATEGLSWSGCAGIGIGVAILVAAIVVGIVAIVKSKSVAAVQKDYQQQMSDTSSAYASNKIDMQNQPQTSVNEIQANNNDVQYNNSKINSLANDINNADPNSSSYASDVSDWSNQIKQLNQNTENDIAQNEYLTANMNNWNDPNYKAAQLANLAVQFQNDESNLQSQESTAVQMVPGNQALAKSLGIGAGIGAAVGIYLLVDGLTDNGC